MNSLTDFIVNELYPVLYERIDSVFSSMHFKKVGGDWHSSHYLSGEATSPVRPDKTVITKAVPHRILEQGGASLSLVDFWLQSNGNPTNLKGEELVEALRPLCSLLGLSIPDYDTEEYRAYKERQETLERFASKMKRALYTEEGKETLTYLKEGRGWTDEEIKATELGFCSEETARELEGAPYGAGSTYTLALPYRSGGRILGFKFRAIKKVKPKFKNSIGLPKKASLFGLTGLKLTGNGEKDRDIVVVEGELDALRAQIRGVENIVACSGLDLSEEAIQEAKDRGVKRVTILTDTEETPEYARAKALESGEDVEEKVAKAKKRIEDNKDKVDKAIRSLGRAGLTSLVAKLPQGKDGAKEDVDSFLNSHSVEELRTIINNASTGANYLFNQIYQRAVARQGGEPTITDKAYNDYKEETISLLNDVEVVSPVDKDIILSLFSRSTSGAGITKEALQAEADARKEVADRRRQEEQTQALIKKASALASNGRIEDSLRLLADQVPEVRKISRETEFSSLLITPTVANIRERLRTRPEGVKTDYIFSTGQREERLVLPSGALTLVAALPSHGKSTFIRNLALQTAGNGEEGTVLYFTFEEDYESTLVEFVNTYVGEILTQQTKDYNNLTTIIEYYRTNSTQYMKEKVRETFQTKQAEFMRDYIESGRLRIYDFDYKSGELLHAIQYIAKSQKVKAVFIDYVQLLYKEGNRLQRNEELKEIAKDFRQTAKGLTIPIVLAAQLNRKAMSPTDMNIQNIADSADLEREANKVILLWNSAFTAFDGGTYDKAKVEKPKQMELGKEGQIYARIAKNRGGIPAIDALLNYNGNTGRIEPNAETDFPDEKGQGGLF